MRTLTIGLLAVLFVSLAAAAQQPESQTPGTIEQLMEGIYFPDSNLIFDAQIQDPEGPPDPFPLDAGPRRPFEGIYGGWEAVENAALALAATSGVLLEPGRVCSNGVPAPVQNEDWVRWVGDMREAALAAYVAAQHRSQEELVDVSNALYVTCLDCHNRYRGPEDAVESVATLCR